MVKLPVASEVPLTFMKGKERPYLDTTSRVHFVKVDVTFTSVVTNMSSSIIDLETTFTTFVLVRPGRISGNTPGDSMVVKTRL